MFHETDILLSPVNLRTFSERKLWMPKRAVEYEPWRRMEADSPVQSEVIPGQSHTGRNLGAVELTVLRGKAVHDV